MDGKGRKENTERGWIRVRGRRRVYG